MKSAGKLILGLIGERTVCVAAQAYQWKRIAPGTTLGSEPVEQSVYR
jgi:hypothetical protein